MSGGGWLSVGRMSEEEVARCVRIPPAFSVAGLASARPSLTDAETVTAVGLAERAIAAIDQHTQKGSRP